MSGMMAYLVPRDKVEALRVRLLKAGYLDGQRKIVQRGDMFEIPITDAALSELSEYAIVTQKRVEYYEKNSTLRELMEAHLEPFMLDLLPSGWQILGDIIITSLHRDLFPESKKVGFALLQMYPYCKSVYLDQGIEGALRRPNRTLLVARAGIEDPASTVHSEHGCRFKLDVTRIMFSKGNLNERIRMSGLGRDELVVDMFAGIGYFAIPMAVHARPARVLAIELNPESYAYLVENIRLNNVENVVEPVLGDCSEKTPVGIGDRVIMGYVGRTSRYLGHGIRALKRGGVLHFHDTAPIHLVPGLLIEHIEKQARDQGRTVLIQQWHRVKKYGPGTWHVVVDAMIL